MTRLTFRTFFFFNVPIINILRQHGEYIRWTDIQNEHLYVVTEKDILYTGKPQYNESEGTKDFFIYSRDFVIAGAFSYRINYRGT
jgi:hypothetical protein